MLSSYIRGGMRPRCFPFAIFLIFLACVANAREGNAVDEGKTIFPIRFNVPLDLERMLGSGDVAAIDKALSRETNQGAVYVFNAMKYRILGDLKTSSSNAQNCISGSVGNGQRFAKFGITCYQILAGNYLISNDLYSWSKTYSELDTLIKSLGLSLAARDVKFKNVDPKRIEVRILGELDTNFHAFYESGAKSPPRLGMIEEKYILKRGEDRNGQHSFFVFANINGHRFPVLLDTGVPISVIRDEPSIHDGLKPVASDVIRYVGVSDGDNTTPRFVGIGFAKGLDIGGVKMGDDYPVLITSTGPKISAIGLDFFTRFHRVKIRKRQIELNPEPETCTNELRILSKLPGFYRLALKGSIDGKAEWIFIDTGTQDALTATASSGLDGKDEVKRERITAGGRSVISTSQTEVSLNGIKLPTTVSKGYQSFFSYVIGDGALDHFDIYLDFDGMTGCLNQADANKTGRN